MQKKLIASLIVTLTVFVLVSPVLAHRPVWGESLGPIEVDDISVSYAFYQELRPGELDVFYFEGQAGQKLHAGIQIPAIPALQDYGVTVALLGPGLPEADETKLPENHPEGLGALVSETKISADFYEPFTQNNYWGRQQIDMLLPETGTYYLLIWQLDGSAGKYLMDIGYKEVFTPLDFFAFPIWWVRAQLFHENIFRVVAVFGGMVIGIGALVTLRLLQKSKRIFRDQTA